jgi:hypothetical protein
MKVSRTGREVFLPIRRSYQVSDMSVLHARLGPCHNNGGGGGVHMQFYLNCIVKLIIIMWDQLSLIPSVIIQGVKYEQILYSQH